MTGTRVILAGCLTVVMVTAGGFSAVQAQTDAAAGIRAIIHDAQHTRIQGPDFPYYQDEMEALYGPQAYRPLWVVDGTPREQVGDVVAILKQAEECGLPAQDADVQYLETGWARIIAGTDVGADDLAALDTATSLLLLRRISDLHIGRVNPQRLGFGLDIEPRKYDLAALVRAGLAEDRLLRLAEEAEPQFYQYRALKAALRTYRALAKQPLAPLTGRATVRPGEALAERPQLVALLAAVGDLPATSAPASGRYDGDVVEGVKRFQMRHGLQPDGVLGPATWKQLQVPLDARVRQIELALERLRWLPVADSPPFLVVNVPSFRLYGFAAGDEFAMPSLQMNVVVGKAARSKTPVFADRMRYVVFSPHWFVPRSIVKNEILAKLDEDPRYLETHRLDLVATTTDEAAALPATPANLEQLRAGRLSLRQRPGPQNALGRVKFIFPNSHDVYLHDTPSRSAFARERRDFSHGCIRVEDPAALAQFVLSDQPAWTSEAIAKAMAGDKPRRVDLTRPLPIVIFYATAICRPDGAIMFYDDIYGYDAQLDEALLEGEPYAP